MIITTILTMLGILFFVIIVWGFLTGIAGAMVDGQEGSDQLQGAEKNIALGVLGFLTVVAIGVLRGFGIIP